MTEPLEEVGAYNQLSVVCCWKKLMYATPSFSSGGAWGQPPLPPPINPNLSLQNSINLYMYLSNLASCTPHYGYNVYPTFPIQNPNFPIQNPSLTSTQFSNPGFRPQNSKELLERIDRAVGKARSDLIAAGESVSAWKVSQSALLILQVDCWSSLGFQMQQVPSLHRLMLTEGKVMWTLFSTLCFFSLVNSPKCFMWLRRKCGKRIVIDVEDEQTLPVVIRRHLVWHVRNIWNIQKTIFDCLLLIWTSEDYIRCALA